MNRAFNILPRNWKLVKSRQNTYYLQAEPDRAILFLYRDSGLSDKRGPVRRIVVELIDKLGKVMLLQLSLIYAGTHRVGLLCANSRSDHVS